nr:retrovirus-related Pol polyprotein from transposon TNT 1-94 [Tanacetum cinerariifolium]
MESCDLVGTPMKIKDKLNLDQNGTPVDATKYRSMIEFSDANYAGCKDTFKSTSGGSQFLGEKLVSWSSKKQECTMLSTAEAEYVSLYACCAQVLWMRTQLTDYGFHFNRISIYCYSKSAIAISCNPGEYNNMIPSACTHVFPNLRTFRVIVFSIHSDEWKSFQSQHQIALRSSPLSNLLFFFVFMDVEMITLSIIKPTFKGRLKKARKQLSYLTTPSGGKSLRNLGDIYDDPSFKIIYQNDDLPSWGNSRKRMEGEERPDWVVKTEISLVVHKALFVVKDKLSSLEDTTVLGSFLPLPTQVTTSAGNSPSKSLYANVTDSIRAISERFAIQLMVLSWGRSKDGLSSIATKLDNTVMAMPKIIREGHYTCNVCVEYEWRCSSCKVFGHIHKECLKNIGVGEKKTVKKPSQTSRGVPIGQKIGFKPKKEYRPILKKSTASSSGNKKKGVESTIEVSKSNPFDVLNSFDNDGKFDTNSSNTPIGEKIFKMERKICKGKHRLLDNDRNSLALTRIMESNSEVEVVFDETANLRISKSGKDGSDKGYGTNKLLEQWRDSYPNNDDYDPYNDDMYENHEMSEHLQSICDDLDITIHGRKKI